MGSARTMSHAQPGTARVVLRVWKHFRCRQQHGPRISIPTCTQALLPMATGQSRAMGQGETFGATESTPLLQFPTPLKGLQRSLLTPFLQDALPSTTGISALLSVPPCTPPGTSTEHPQPGLGKGSEMHLSPGQEGAPARTRLSHLSGPALTRDW